MSSMLHNNEVIAIEEDLLNWRTMIRKFTIQNRLNHLRIGILTSGAMVTTCKLDNGAHEIIVNNNPDYDLSSPRWQHVKPNWVSHVHGVDTLRLTTGGASGQSQSIVYRLNPDNELIVIGKFKTQQQYLQPYYFNLKSALDKSSIDGHLLHVKSSDNSDITHQPLNVGASSEEFYNFASENPREIQSVTDTESIYSINGGNQDSAIIAVLQYEQRRVEVTLQSTHTIQSQCRLKIRISKNGVCIMPTMMSDFKCVYKFMW